MKKISKLVRTSFVTRVIVNDTDSEEQIIAKAKKKLYYQVDDEISEIVDDTECPLTDKELDILSERRFLFLAKYGIIESTDENGNLQVQRIDDVVSFQLENNLPFRPIPLSSDKEAQELYDRRLKYFLDIHDNDPF